MSLITTAPKGTQDILPERSHIWRHIESTLLDTARLYGFEQMRTPTFEHTELFLRSVGETTDVVSKEMYTFTDKGNRSITLRPEGTAGVARAALERGLLAGALPVRVSYLINCFRYENKQKMRYREFNQFGVELYGTVLPQADVEIISLAYECYRVLGLGGVSIQLNSLGCAKCRPNYQRALLEYLNNYRDELCGTCHERMEKNPLRILDCKVPACKNITKSAPTMLEHLCKDCIAHLDEVKTMLTTLKIPFVVNPRIVRGLDYYTRTVFECVLKDTAGDEIVVGGGGRYSGLISELGGADCEGIGFALGIERIEHMLNDLNLCPKRPSICKVYIAPMDKSSQMLGLELIHRLRGCGISAQTDIMGKSLKAQMKYADKLSADFTVVIGENEILSKTAVMRNMSDGTTYSIPLDDGFVDAVREII